jgi:two-component system invasion response regulator UvrY
MDKTKVIHVAIADDHFIVRKGLAELINGFGSFRVSLEASNGEELLHQLDKMNETPDLCLLDINMPKMNGYETIVNLKQRWPGIRVLAFSMFCNEFSIIKMIRSGANGYLNKNCKPDELRNALLQLHQGGRYYSEKASACINDVVSRENDLSNRISEREFCFLSHCCTEATYKEIAAQMFVSPRTAEMYRDNLFEKLGIKTRTGLVLFAIQTGIVPLAN